MQAKSGTGKTLAFAICILENYNAELKFPQSLVIVPTREIAVQIVGVLNELGRNQKGFKACEFIGGMEIANDRKKIQNTKVIVGTPGRVLHLISNQIFNISNIKTLVLDEADKLLESGKMAKEVMAILNAMQKKIQILAATATVTDQMEKILKRSMKNPIGITPKHEVPVLLGIKQFVKVFPRENDNIAMMNAKVDELVNIFARIPFKQCLLFTDSQSKTESYSKYLNKREWRNEVISAAQEQSQRLIVLDKLIKFKCRLLITTDLLSRGIDCENINLIVNLDLPYDCFTYLHRIGRAGRFGSHGLAITFINGEVDLPKYQKILGGIGGDSLKALKYPGEEINYDFWCFDKENDETLETIAGFSEHNGDDGREESQGATAQEETVMHNLALLEIARKLVDDKVETKSFDLNAILEDYEKNSTEVETNNHAEASENTIDESIFLKAIEDLNLYADEHEEEKQSDKQDITEEKEVRHVIFNRAARCEDDEMHSETADDTDLSGTESEEEEVDDEREYLKKESQQHKKQSSVQSDPCANTTHQNQFSMYHQYVASNYSRWENIYHFQLANIQNYLQSGK